MEKYYLEFYGRYSKQLKSHIKNRGVRYILSESVTYKCISFEIILMVQQSLVQGLLTVIINVYFIATPQYNIIVLVWGVHLLLFNQ